MSKTKFKHTLDNHVKWSAVTNHVVVALSGGVDSFALTILLQDYLKNKPIKLTALTIDHGLQEGSDKEAKALQKKLKTLGVNHHILTWEKPNKITTGIQKKARQARYELIKNWCLENKVNTVFLGHHQEDQVETFWLRSLKKSGINGLSCMSFLRQDYRSEIFFIRPLLSFSKQELKAVCNKYQQSWFEDPSNQSTSYTRNIIRHNLDVFPLNNESVLRLIACFSKIRKDLQKQTMIFLKNSAIFHEEGYISLNKEHFKTLNSTIQKQVLQNILVALSGNNYPPKIETALINLQNNNDFTLSGCIVSCEKDSFVFCREYREIPQKQLITKPSFIWNELFQIEILNFAEGLSISPLGRKGLSFLTKTEKSKCFKKYILLPKNVRQIIPIIKKNEEIMAIPHLNYKNNNIKIKLFPKTSIFGVYIEIV